MKRVLAVLLVAGLVSVPDMAHAAFPGENGKIAFTSNRDSPAAQNRTEIYSMAADGTGQTRLTVNPSVFDFSPRWSPDGRQIAFYVPPVAGTDFGIFVMNADGGAKTELTSDGGLPAWSPDGDEIVFNARLSDSQGPSDIYVMDADGSDVRRLTGTIGLDSEPSWSPDGSRIAFSGTGLGLGAGDIFMVNADGTGLVNMTESVAHETHPDWSPDGRKIAFFSDRSCPFGEIYTMDAAGGDPVQVTDGCQSFDLKPAWSPDGSRIAFTSNSGGNFDIYSIRPDGSGRTNLTNHPADEGDSDWQPLNRPPDCSAVRATPALLGAPSHRLVMVTVSGATDPDGDQVDLAITGVTQDEPVTGPPDAVATTIPHRVRLRAERDPHRDGRVYRIAFEANDGRGGTCTGFATAGVRKGSQAPVDSAPPSYDSFGS